MTELVVAGDPTVGQLPATAAKQFQANTPAFLEDHVLGDIGLEAVAAVISALLGQVQAASINVRPRGAA